jgi:hypothetical protein
MMSMPGNMGRLPAKMELASRAASTDLFVLTARCRLLNGMERLSIADPDREVGKNVSMKSIIMTSSDEAIHAIAYLDERTMARTLSIRRMGADHRTPRDIGAGARTRANCLSVRAISAAISLFIPSQLIAVLSQFILDIVIRRLPFRR